MIGMVSAFPPIGAITTTHFLASLQGHLVMSIAHLLPYIFAKTHFPAGDPSQNPPQILFTKNKYSPDADNNEGKPQYIQGGTSMTRLPDLIFYRLQHHKETMPIASLKMIR